MCTKFSRYIIINASQFELRPPFEHKQKKTKVDNHTDSFAGLTDSNYLYHSGLAHMNCCTLSCILGEAVTSNLGWDASQN